MDSWFQSIAVIILAGFRLSAFGQVRPWLARGVIFSEVFENCLVFWHTKVSQARLACFLTRNRVKPFLQGDLVPLVGIILRDDSLGAADAYFYNLSFASRPFLWKELRGLWKQKKSMSFY